MGRQLKPLPGALHLGSAYDLFISGGNFGFNTFASGGLLGINDDIFDDQWVHVAAVFINGDGTTNELFINGVSQVLSEKAGGQFTPFATQNYTIAGVFGLNGIIDDFRIL